MKKLTLAAITFVAVFSATCTSSDSTPPPFLTPESDPTVVPTVAEPTATSTPASVSNREPSVDRSPSPERPLPSTPVVEPTATPTPSAASELPIAPSPTPERPLHPTPVVEPTATRTPSAASELPIAPSPTPKTPSSSAPVTLDLPQGVSGILEHSSGARIAVPEGATAEETIVTISEVDPPDSPVNVGRVFDFSVGDAYLYEPVTLSIPFELESGVSASEIQALHWDEEIESWIVLNGEVVDSEMAIVVTVSDLSLFSTAGPSESDSSDPSKPAFMPWLTKVEVPETPLVGQTFTIDWWAQNAGGSRLSETDQSAVGYVRLVSPEPQVEDARIAAYTERTFLPDNHEWNPGRTYSSKKHSESTGFTVTPTVPGVMTVRIELVFEGGDGAVLGSDVVEREVIVTDHIAIRPAEVIVDGESYEVSGLPDGDGRVDYVVRGPDGRVSGTLQDKAVFTAYYQQTARDSRANAWLMENLGWIKFAARYTQLGGVLSSDVTFFMDQFSTMGSLLLSPNVHSKLISASHVASELVVKFLKETTKHPEAITEKIALDAYDRSLDILLDEIPPLLKRVRDGNPLSFSEAIWVAENLAYAHAYQKPSMTAVRMIAANNMGLGWDGDARWTFAEQGVHIAGLYLGLEAASDTLSIVETASLFNELTPSYAEFEPWQTMVKGIESNLERLSSDYREELGQIGISDHEPFQHSLFIPIEIPHYTQIGTPVQADVDSTDESLGLASVSTGVSHACSVLRNGTVTCWGYNGSGQASPPSGAFSSVSAGNAYTCGVRLDGTVKCWGDNEWGQASPPSGEFTSVSAGFAHTCGVLVDGSVKCWGNNELGQSSPRVGEFLSVSAGDLHTCGVLLDGSVKCWGSDGWGESSPPSDDFLSVSAGGDFYFVHTCGVTLDGSVRCWGSDRFGQSSPPSGDFTSVNAGNRHTCGVLVDGSVVCWGSDRFGQSSPPSGEFTSVSAGNDHTCGVLLDGSIACWGDDRQGQASPPSVEVTSVPDAALDTDNADGLLRFSSVSANGIHACGVLLDGSVRCWGHDDRSGKASPPSGAFLSVSVGWRHTCGVRLDGAVECWGNNDAGQSTPPAGEFSSVSAGDYHTCGIREDSSVACWGDDNRLTIPRLPPGNFTSISAGGEDDDIGSDGRHMCGVLLDGSVQCWGADQYGQSSPPSGEFTSVSAGGAHTCGVQLDGSIVCWGSNEYGKSKPPSGEFTSVGAGYAHTCGVRIDGTVECWGWDEYGQSTSPSGEFLSVSAGLFHTCGMLSDGSIACWGRDDYGQSTPPSGEFTSVPDTTQEVTPEVDDTDELLSFSSVSAGLNHTCGLLADGSVACWGDDDDGQSTPPSGKFSSVSAGTQHTCGLLVDGSAECWGGNSYGESSPPSGKFSSINAGSYYTCGVLIDGSVKCWGSGDEDGGPSSPPRGEFASVSAGQLHTCGVRVDGSVECWGWAEGAETTPPPGEFMSVSAGDRKTCGVQQDGMIVCWGSLGRPPSGIFSSVSEGYGHTCGVRTDGSVACSGSDRFGESSPPSGEFTSVSAGWSHTCGVLLDGSVACWGDDGAGQSTPPSG